MRPGGEPPYAQARGGFDAVVGHLVGTLTALGVPEDTIGQIGQALTRLRGAIVTASRAGLAG